MKARFETPRYTAMKTTYHLILYLNRYMLHKRKSHFVALHFQKSRKMLQDNGGSQGIYHDY